MSEPSIADSADEALGAFAPEHAIPVQALDDPALAPFLAVRERDLVGRAGEFVLEGRVVLLHALEFSLHPIDAILAADSKVERFAREAQAAFARRGEASAHPAPRLYRVPDALLDAAAGFHVHRGLLGVGRALPPESLPRFLERILPRDPGAPARIVVLCGIANHDNLGGIFRNAAAFGISAVLLDATTCSPFYRKAIRVSAGASLSVPWLQMTPEAGQADDLLAALEKAGFTCFALTGEAARSLFDAALPARSAFVFGAEGPGLPANLRAAGRIDALAIPMSGRLDSLNVAAASAVTLAWAFEQAGRFASPAPALASA